MLIGLFIMLGGICATILALLFGVVAANAGNSTAAEQGVVICMGIMVVCVFIAIVGGVLFANGKKHWVAKQERLS